MWDFLKKNITVFVVSSMYFFLAEEEIVYAKKTIGDAGSALNTAVAPTGLPKKDVAIYVGEVAQWIFGITGLLFFLLMVYAGMMWFFARGEDDKISDARKTIIAAIIGLFIAVSGYAITTFVTSSLGL